jgi:hypothetical protein
VIRISEHGRQSKNKRGHRRGNQLQHEIKQQQVHGDRYKVWHPATNSDDDDDDDDEEEDEIKPGTKSSGRDLSDSNEPAETTTRTPPREPTAKSKVKRARDYHKSKAELEKKKKQEDEKSRNIQ